jgi:hypothetical protein
MKTPIEKLEHNAAALKRWRTRLKRALSQVDKLEKQRRRLLAAANKVVPLDAILAVAPPMIEQVVSQFDEPLLPPTVVTTPAPAADLAIPSWLQRTPDPAAEQLKQEQAELKKAKARARIETMKAKQRGDLKRMPLSGRDALKAIREG